MQKSPSAFRLNGGNGEGFLHLDYLFDLTNYHLSRPNIRSGWRTRANQITTCSKLQEIAQNWRSVAAAGHRRHEGDKVGCAREQAFVVHALFVFPPDVGTADIRSTCFVTGAALEGQVVGEDMGAHVEGKIALIVVP